MDTLRTWAEFPNYSHRFHVLVVGAEGVGKSCLMRHTLGSEHQITPHSAGGDWDLAPGVSSLRNPRFVMHELGYVLDSDPNNPEDIAKIRRFVEAKTNQPFEHQIHAIWFCVRIPFIDSLRVFTPLELEFLVQLDPQTSVPVIVIFTQFDSLISRLDEELSLPDTEDAAEQLTLRRAHLKYEESCLEPLSRITPRLPYVRTSGLSEQELDAESQQSLNTLLQTTRDLTERYLRRSLTIPEHGSASDKVENSIQIAMKVYYRTVFSDFWGRRLEDILAKLHRDTTRTWNLDDPMVRRDSLQFVSEVQRISSVPTLSDHSKMSWSNLLDRYQILISLLLGTTISVSLGRVALALAMCLWFAYICTRMQQHLPETLRSFLEYTIHLTLLLDRILNALTSPHTGRPHPLTEAEIMRALGEYQGSEAAAQVHSEVQLFVDDACESPLRMWRGLRRGRAEELVKELVQRWRAGVENVALQTLLCPFAADESDKRSTSAPKQRRRMVSVPNIQSPLAQAEVGPVVANLVLGNLVQISITSLLDGTNHLLE
ncbi:hypothetical protein C8F01DRAFT_1369417 [Mycena amicta]|nr:hypothetical protein C8F01DRAFT_1369417 [Mycena amicta]